MMELQEAVNLYADMLGAVLPCAFVFACCNLAVNIILGAWMTGKLKIGGKV